ncbi:MAG: glycosyltransferase family 4 protein [Phaeodactylibacter sp.]|nr:glycosyltransferase family 4 protein [Phaeodactylibacter sp.]
MRKRQPPNTAKQRIALVANSSWYTYNFRIGLLRRLKDEGYEVYVLAPKDHYSTRLIAEGYRFIHLPIGIYNRNPFSELAIILQLIRIYRRYRFALIFHYTAKPNIYGTLAAAWCRIPSIAITTGLGLLRGHSKRFSRLALMALYRLAALFTNEMWFLNRDDQQLFLDKGVIGPGKAVLLPSEGVDIRWFRPQGGERPAAAPTRFLYAGRIVWSKGIREFYEAARYFRDRGAKVSFEMVGFIVPEHPDGVSYELVQEWKQQGILHYLGETEDIRPFLAEADCVVLPSFFGEGVPRILLEAASMARPIITTDYVGCRDVVEHGRNGLLCRPKDPQSLISAMEFFLSMSPEERYRMGLAGRKKVVREFDEQIVIGDYFKAINRYLPGKKRRRAVHSSKKAH